MHHGPPPPPWLLGLLSLAGLGAGVWLYASGFKRLRLRRKVANTPTARIRSVAMGPAEIGGLAEPLDQPLPGPFSGQPCAWWRYTVEEEKATQTKDGTVYEWEQVRAEVSAAPFQLEQDGARLVVLPQGAEIDAPRLLEYVVGNRAGVGFFSVFGASRRDETLFPGPAALEWTAGYANAYGRRRRLREWRIDVKRPVFALGVVRPLHADEVPGAERRAALEAGREGEPFLITTESEPELLHRLGLGVAGRLVAGTALVVAACWALALILTT